MSDLRKSRKVFLRICLFAELECLSAFRSLDGTTTFTEIYALFLNMDMVPRNALMLIITEFISYPGL